MARIDFPLGFVGEEDLPQTQQNLQNCFNNGKGQVLTRPGIHELTDTRRMARGQFVWNGFLYQVQSELLVKIDKVTGLGTDIGAIGGESPIVSAVGFNEVAIVAQGGKSYTLDKLDVLVDTSANPNFVPYICVTHIDNRFVYVPSDGDPAQVSDVGDAGSIQALAFIDAEQLPDKNNSCFNLSTTLMIGGTDSFQPFRNSGVGPVWFAAVPNSRIDVGFIGGLLEYNNSYLFIGREKDQDAGVYLITQGQAPKISNSRIDKILSTYTPLELSKTVASRFKWRGYDIATLTLRRDSWGFLGGNWFPLETVLDGMPRPWGGGYITQFEGEYFTAFRSSVGKLTKINKDYGNPTTRLIEFTVNEGESDFFRIQSIELGISQGFNSDDGSVALYMSRDGVTYGPPVFRNLGDIGQYTQKLIWNPPGGLGAYDGFAAVRIYTAEDVEFSADKIIVNLR